MTDLKDTIELAKNLVATLESGLEDQLNLHVNEVVEMLTAIGESAIEALTERVSAKQLGFQDDRVGTVLVQAYPSVMITDGGFSAYYAGFDYVEADCVSKMGRYTIWSNMSDRVDEHLEYYMMK